MGEQLSKLRPDRDLQCYFLRPSTVAALSQTSATGFTVSGCWRQQFDWVVIEWNRDNVFEHPALRNLPDGDLSGLHLSYEDSRINCIPLDSSLYPTVDWPYLRIWSGANGSETLYSVPLANYATAVGSYAAATAQFTLQGTLTVNDYIELAWLDQHFNHQIAPGDTAGSALDALAAAINESPTAGVSATANGNQITLTCLSARGSNGNRMGAYGTVHGAGTESWTPWWSPLSGGQSPTQWRVDLDFSNLHDVHGALVPTSHVRKMRWTWAADLQSANFTRSEFAITVSNWTVSGTNLEYEVAGPGSRRIEDDATDFSYQGLWTEVRGNYSGGSIRWTATPGSQVRCTYSAQGAHSLYLGTRIADSGAQITAQVDSAAPAVIPLQFAGEDVLVRVLLARFSGSGNHAIILTHTGAPDSYFYLDFLEIAVPTQTLPAFGESPKTTLATDWDTDHSLALAPERTAWLIRTLGFGGRANHYAGALWFYELLRPGHKYATGTIQFSGEPEWSKTTQISLGPTVLEHLNLIGDTAQSIAKCFELLVNSGSTGVWAQATGSSLTITARAMGSSGSAITLSATTNGTTFAAQTSGPNLAGGADGLWHTDLNAVPRLNRAARDWNRSFLAALKSYGMDATVAFSMELQHGDDSLAAGIAQRYPNGDACWLNTPALQSNFSPASTAFWEQVYLDMAGVMADAGLIPYLQFGEVQWWYFAALSGMPFYDDDTKSAFQTVFGRSMGIVPGQNAAPSDFPDECSFLPTRIGKFTDSIMACVRQSHANARFEVLYPPDVNDTPLNRVINLPSDSWTPAKLSCLKTENFTYTGDRDLNKARASIDLPLSLGFTRSQSSHLVGISDYTTPWEKERILSLGEGIESLVLFALDQFCLIGYSLPLKHGRRRSLFMGD